MKPIFCLCLFGSAFLVSAPPDSGNEEKQPTVVSLGDIMAKRVVVRGNLGVPLGTPVIVRGTWFERGEGLTHEHGATHPLGRLGGRRG